MNTETAEILVARTSAVFTENGRKFRIIKGKTTARRGVKILRGREHLFVPLVLDFDTPGPLAEAPKKRGRPRKVEVTAEIS